MYCIVQYIQYNSALFNFTQRIYIYIEFKATPLRLCSRGLLPQKAGTRITVHLSAAWSTIFVGLESIMQVYTVGWVNFCTFFSNLVGNFMHLHVVYSSPRYNTGNRQISLTFLQKPMKSTTLKVPIFKKMQGAKCKNQKLSFWKIDSLISLKHSEKS